MIKNICKKCSKLKKDPFLMVNTSSPDRSMDVLPKLFLEIKKQVPEAKLFWCYGWETFDASFKNDKKMMEWRNKIQKECDDAGIISLGKLPQSECADVYLSGSIFVYPSCFYEIDCISVKKAQVADCYPVTTDFAALNESNINGSKIHTKITKDDWNKPYQWHFGLEDEKEQKEWVDEVVRILKGGKKNDAGVDISKTFEWSRVATSWANIFN